MHSSTLVTAGVYVLIRFNYVFLFHRFNFLKILFLFTMLMAGAGALLERDFKKIVAMSTLRQLGIMLFILSLGGWCLSFLHIIIHAFFKSILFLRTGSLIGQMGGAQDARLYGGFYMNYFSFIYFIVRCLCLIGFPFFLGFYSKDLILLRAGYYEGVLFYLCFLLGCVFTVMYGLRLLVSGFVLGFKYVSFRGSSEIAEFFLPVFMLFLKC